MLAAKRELSVLFSAFNRQLIVFIIADRVRSNRSKTVLTRGTDDARAAAQLKTLLQSISDEISNPFFDSLMQMQGNEEKRA